MTVQGAGGIMGGTLRGCDACGGGVRSVGVESCALTSAMRLLKKTKQGSRGNGANEYLYLGNVD